MMKKVILITFLCATLCGCSTYEDIYNSKLHGQSKIDYITNKINENPNDYMYYFYRGLEYSIMNKYDLAIKDYTYTIKINPHYYSAYFNRAVDYQKINKTNLAIADFKKVIELKGDDVSAFRKLGILY